MELYAANDFVEFQNYTAFEREAIAPKFLREKFSEKN